MDLGVAQAAGGGAVRAAARVGCGGRRWWTALAIAAVLGGAAGCQGPAVPAPGGARAPAAASVAAAAVVDGAAGAALDFSQPSAAAVDGQALRALLLNLLDDAEPPRFADPQWFVVCGERTRVWLDGREVSAGQPVPAGSFVLDWALDGACPLGPDGPLLDGKLRMLVIRDPERGFVPVVLARQ